MRSSFRVSGKREHQSSDTRPALVTSAYVRETAPVNEDLLDAARALRGDLDELALPETEILDRRLAELIASALAGIDVEAELRALVYQDERTQLYVEYFAATGAPPDTDAVGGFSPVPGPPSPVPLEKYSCPRGDYDWYRRSPGQEVPRCPTHDLALEPADQR